MYNPPTYLTKQVLSDVLKEFKWSDSFVIKDEDCTVDGIKVRFSKCILYFREGFESDMTVYISDDSGNRYWSLFELIHYVFAPKFENTESFRHPVMHNYFSPFASLEKVQYGLRDLCILVQTYLRPCLEGDFSWVEEYNKQHPEL